MRPSTNPASLQVTAEQRPPRLHNGDRLSRAEFERRYEAMPELSKAELIDGIVFIAAPANNPHALAHAELARWLASYAACTPGIERGNRGTVRLDADNEVQPDVYLRILEANGGQAHEDEDGYLTGAPELIAEAALSSVSIDLNAKREAYRRNGVREYVVWRIEDGAIDWFILRRGRYRPLPRTPAGLYQSEILPGLWLDPETLIRGDLLTVSQVVQQGLATPEHTAFVKKLQQAAAAKAPRKRGQRRRRP